MIRGELVLQNQDKSEAILGTHAHIRTDDHVVFTVEEDGTRIKDEIGMLKVGDNTVIKYTAGADSFVVFCKVVNVLGNVYVLEKEYAIDGDPDFIRFYCDWVDSVVEGRLFEGF